MAELFRGGPSLMLIVYNDDAKREFAYDRDSSVGKLDTSRDEDMKQDWNIVSMKDNRGRIFPFQD
jgi:hypothetical protein